MIDTGYSTLYRVPIVEDFNGEPSFAFINPRFVSSLTPDTATVVYGRDEDGDDKEKDVTGTRVNTSEEMFFVPLTPTEVAAKLHITLEGFEDAANA